MFAHPFRRWLQQFSRRVRRPAARTPRRTPFRPWTEVLEDRLAPATIPFTNPSGGDWEAPGNWQGGVIPGPGDVAVLGINYTNVTLNSARIVGGVTASGRDSFLDVRSGGTLQVTGALQLTNNFTLTASAGMVFSQGTFTVTSSNVQVTGGTLDGTLPTMNGGTFTLNGGTVIGRPTPTMALTGVTFNYTTGSISGTLSGTLTSSALNLGPGATGPFDLIVQGSSSLSGAIQAGQTVWVRGGGVGVNAQLTLAAGASNAGTIRLESIGGGFISSLAIPSGVFTNTANGTILSNVGSGGPRTITGNVTNQGLINAAAVLTISGGIYEAAGGSLQGSGYVFDAQVRVTASPATDTTVLLAGDTTLLGNNLPRTVLLVNGTSVYNRHGQLTVAAGASNAGTIRLESSGGGYISSLAIPSGVFTNTANGTILSNVGSGGGPRTITGNLTNQGLINAAAVLTISGGIYEAAGGSLQGSGYVFDSQVRVTASPATDTTVLLAGNTTLLGNNLPRTVLLVNGTSVYNRHAQLTLAAGASNAGTIRLESSGGGYISSLAIPSGVFTNTANGTILSNVGSGGGPRTIAGNLTNQGLINAAAVLTITGGVYEAAGGSIQGSGYVFDAQVRVTASPATDTTVLLAGDTTLLGNNLPRTVLLVNGTSVYNRHAQLTVAAGASNAGTIRLESSGGGYVSNLVVADGGPLNIASNGTLQVNPGRGARTVVGQLVNAGTVQINTTVTLGSTGGTENHVNTGTISIANDATLFVRGNSLTSQAAGLIEGHGFLNTLFSGGSAPLTNLGTVRVPAGAFLRLVGPFQNFSSFDQRLTGGTYEVTGTLRFDGADLRTLSATLVLISPGAQVQNSGGGNALVNLTTIRPDGDFAGSFTIRNGRNFDTNSSIAEFRNEGTLNVGAGSVFRSLRNYTQTADAALNVDRGRMRIEGTFTNAPGGTLTGGQYHITGPDAINRGTLQFTGANVLTNSAAVVLDGSGSEVVDLAGANGLQNFATNNGSFTIQNGRNFTTAGNFANNGTLAIGSSSTFNANSMYTQSAGGALNTTLAGLSQFSRLNVAGNAALDGTLNVSLGGGFVPSLGNHFPILTYASRTGSFATTNLPTLPVGRRLDVVYNPQDLTLATVPTNQPPVLNPIPNQTVNEGSLLTLTAMATDPDLGSILTFSLEPGAPAGASINPTTGVFTWTPTEVQGPGVYSITVRVTDNGTPALSDTRTFTVTVNEVNQAPVLAAIANQTVAVGMLLTVTASATDADLPANTLTFSLDAGAPAGTSINPATGVFTWTPTVAGSYSVTVRVTDNGLPPLSDARTFTITVTAGVNRPPVLSPIADQTISSTQTVLTVPLMATDPDGDPLTFTATAQSLAYVLHQQYGFFTDGEFYQDSGGRNEKWVQGSGGFGWYFILPTGELYQWDGAPGANGTLIGNPGSSYWTDPNRLINPPEDAHATLMISGSTLTITRDPTWVSALVVSVTVSDGLLTDSRTFTVTVTS